MKASLMPPPLGQALVVFSPLHDYNFQVLNYKLMWITFILELFAGCQWETEIKILKHARLLQRWQQNQA